MLKSGTTQFFFCAVFIFCVSVNGYAQIADETEVRFARIHDLSGEVKVKTAAQEVWKKAKKGMLLYESGEIKTDKESTTVVLLDEEGETGKIEMRSDTWIRVAVLDNSGKNNAKKTVIDLAAGQVLAFAEKLRGEATFQVRTPTSTSSVRGERAVFEVHDGEEIKGL